MVWPWFGVVLDCSGIVVVCVGLWLDCGLALHVAVVGLVLVFTIDGLGWFGV